MQRDYGVQYARLYHEHWWWRAREAILITTLRGLDLPPGLDILDVGCGDALSFPALSAFGSVRGIEVDEGLLDPAGPFRARISTRPLGDPIYADPSWRFDLITALDVVEHIADDRAAAAALVDLLRPGGVLLITVPAFGLLWDHHDVINQHHRRYTTGQVRRLLRGTGLELLQLRYVFRGLFVPKLLVKLLNTGRKGPERVVQHNIPAPWINRAAQRFCLWEDRLLRRMLIPFGTSVLAAARKPRSAPA